MKHGWRRPVMVAVAAASVLAACGGDDSDSADEGAPAASQPGNGAASAPNACPAEGCKITIASVAKTGGELRLTLTANFTPEVSSNHFHVYWDTYSSKQVSDDAEPRFGVQQGAWVPTADNPFTTTEAVSVTERGQSTTICVTAGDRDHNVLDPDLFDCRDVRSDLT